MQLLELSFAWRFFKVLRTSVFSFKLNFEESWNLIKSLTKMIDNKKAKREKLQ